MATAENVLTERRSVRSYKKDQISDSWLRAVLEAGLHAPSGRNRPCTIMVACQNAEEIELMRRLNASVMGVDTDPFYGAPTVVVVFADKDVYTHVEDGSLVLGPFQGKPACVRIEKGKGVCGTALASGRSQLVPDVHAFPGHIACDSASASEVVIPLRDRSGAIRGVLDIDSPLKGRFTEDDLRDLEAFTAALESVTAWDL